jgi:hypothetical protein
MNDPANRSAPDWQPRSWITRHDDRIPLTNKNLYVLDGDQYTGAYNRHTGHYDKDAKVDRKPHHGKLVIVCSDHEHARDIEDRLNWYQHDAQPIYMNSAHCVVIRKFDTFSPDQQIDYQLERLKTVLDKKVLPRESEHATTERMQSRRAEERDLNIVLAESPEDAASRYAKGAVVNTTR